MSENNEQPTVLESTRTKLPADESKEVAAQVLKRAAVDDFTTKGIAKFGDSGPILAGLNKVRQQQGLEFITHEVAKEKVETAEKVQKLKKEYQAEDRKVMKENTMETDDTQQLMIINELVKTTSHPQTTDADKTYLDKLIARMTAKPESTENTDYKPTQ